MVDKSNAIFKLNINELVMTPDKAKEISRIHKPNININENYHK